ncbi:MAG: hypothetical protein GY803_10310 [Chloroflexi bacterium]|nr:hypothetical protein [Chloroflexota bacterium]
MTAARKSQEGQILPLAAVALAGLAALVFFAVRITYLFSADSFLRQTIDFAAVAAARPAGNAMAAGQIAIDEDRGRRAAMAELTSSFDQLEFTGATSEEIFANTTIEFISPTAENCESFPGDSVCYQVPAVRVTSTIPFNLFGIIINLTRVGVATASSAPGEGGAAPVLPQPTPVALPTEVFIPTPTP